MQEYASPTPLYKKAMGEKKEEKLTSVIFVLELGALRGNTIFN